MTTVVHVLTSGWNLRAGRARRSRSRTTRTFPSPSFTTAKGETEPGATPRASLKPRGVREGEAARAESFGEEPEVEELLRREDDEPGSAFPILEEEVLAVASRNVRRRDLRLGHGEDGIVGNRAGLDAELGEKREQAGRVERSAVRVVGRHRCEF